MLYVLHLLDRPGTAALRQRVRPEHKAYLAQVAERIAFAGPLLLDDGRTMVGSLLVIDFPSRDALQAAGRRTFHAGRALCRPAHPCLRQPVAAALRLCAAMSATGRCQALIPERVARRGVR